MRTTIDLSKDVEGELYDRIAATTATLRWSSITSDILLSGGSELTTLHNMRDVLLSLQREFSSSQDPRIIFDSDKKDNFNKRLLLIESEIEGLMKRRINYTSGGSNLQGTERTLDYSTLINEKENQIVELEKKINNLEERLRRSSSREIELENRIVVMQQQLIVKEAIITGKNEVILAEVASTNAMKEAVNRLKRNLDTNRSRIGDLDKLILDGVVIP